MSKHTAIPWHKSNLLSNGAPLIQAKSADGTYFNLFECGPVSRAVFGYEEMENNANFAVEAVNSHDDFVDTLKMIRDKKGFTLFGARVLAEQTLLKAGIK